MIYLIINLLGLVVIGLMFYYMIHKPAKELNKKALELLIYAEECMEELNQERINNFLKKVRCYQYHTQRE